MRIEPVARIVFRDSRRRRGMAVKGSLGSRMKTMVKALERRFPGKTALDEAAV
jgi:hypothetical protein